MEVGSLVDGKYRIVRLLGEGGMGAVYEGVNVLIERRVAIKLLHLSASARDPKLIRRFQKEAQAAGKIGNDHILEVLDLGVLPSGESYIVMEFLDGESLGARLTRQRILSPQELKPLLEQALDGLRAAHRAGIIHRDLKPDNLFILKEKAGRKDYVKIIDFGISRFEDADESMRMTKTGALLGTPYYMSPEQARGADQVTPASDIYSLGVIAYEALTGTRPFEGATYNELLFKIVMSDATPLTTLAPRMDRDFSAIIAKAMHRDPTERFQNADQFLKALSEFRGFGATMEIGTPGPLVDELGSLPQRKAAARLHERAKGPEPNGEDQEADLPSVIPLSRAPRWMLPVVVGTLVTLALVLFLATRGGETHSEGSAASSASVNVTVPTPEAPSTLPPPAALADSTSEGTPPKPIPSGASSPSMASSPAASSARSAPVMASATSPSPARTPAIAPNALPKDGPKPPESTAPALPSPPPKAPSTPSRPREPDFGY